MVYVYFVWSYFIYTALACCIVWFLFYSTQLDVPHGICKFACGYVVTSIAQRHTGRERFVFPSPLAWAVALHCFPSALWMNAWSAW